MLAYRCWQRSCDRAQDGDVESGVADSRFLDSGDFSSCHRALAASESARNAQSLPNGQRLVSILF
jgi:hypothetical protein